MFKNKIQERCLGPRWSNRRLENTAYWSKQFIYLIKYYWG